MSGDSSGASPAPLTSQTARSCMQSAGLTGRSPKEPGFFSVSISSWPLLSHLTSSRSGRKEKGENKKNPLHRSDPQFSHARESNLPTAPPSSERYFLSCVQTKKEDTKIGKQESI